jgi:serine/threonine-protein kinase
MQSLSGSQLGKYLLKEKLGQGGMATVYRAVDPVLGRDVAIKVMHPFIAERSEACERFEREARAVGGLRHRNILQVHDYAPATAEHPAYLVMELLSGPSLHRFIVEHGAPLAEVAAMIGLRVAEALSAAHASGIIHRDVKPENVMFDHQARVSAGAREAARPATRLVLCDFGIARVASGDGMTATGTLLGSPAYMSPEQASGHDIDVRSDQFSLGSLLYQLTTGTLPFSGQTPLGIMAKIVRGEYVPVSVKNPRVPPYLERVIARLLKVDPDARFRSVDECGDALRIGLGDDGFVDVDAEVAAYVADPAAYNQAAIDRILAGARAQARRAKERGETARALAAANRVLAWEPRDIDALTLARGLSRRPSLRVLMAAAALLAAGLAAGGRLALHHRRAAAAPALTSSA